MISAERSLAIRTCASCHASTGEGSIIINPDSSKGAYNPTHFYLCQDCATRLTNELSTLLLDRPMERAKETAPLGRAISSIEETLEVELALDVQEVVSEFIKAAFLLEVTLPDGTSVRATRFVDDVEEETLYCRYCDEELYESDVIRGAEEGDGVPRCPKCGNEVVRLEKDDLD